MNANDFKTIVQKGTYYFPANKHYAGYGHVICDRCSKTNIECSIGYQNLDMCMVCVDIISKQIANTTMSRNQFDRPMTRMLQPQFDRPMTRMLQEQFRTSNSLDAQFGRPLPRPTYPPENKKEVEPWDLLEEL